MEGEEDLVGIHWVLNEAGYLIELGLIFNANLLPQIPPDCSPISNIIVNAGDNVSLKLYKQSTL